jgi:elongation factor P
MISTSDFKKGMTIVFNSQSYLIVNVQFVNPGKGSAFYRVKLKNLKTGQALEHTFKSGETVEEANLQYKKCQYLYNQGNEYFFMDMDSYEQFSLDKEKLADQLDFLKEGIEVYAMYLDNNPCAINLPPKMTFKVIEAEAGVKGDTASGGDKTVTIESGAKIKVPLFIKEGDVIRINTESREYDTRVQ